MNVQQELFKIFMEELHTVDTSKNTASDEEIFMEVFNRSKLKIDLQFAHDGATRAVMQEQLKLWVNRILAE